MTLLDFLFWLTGIGSVVALSWVSEQLEWFQALAPDKKKLFQMVGSSVIGIAALAIRMYAPAEILQQLEPFFSVLVTVFTFVYLNQMAHLNNPARR